ncbi:HEPN domain-containing protein [Taklimakanibacter lacteus]|uniref:HEPN domain-containing protein n=1 Tax=Taklimakanibacter lacteus TaxID=2268456 RepID=UPI0013C50890
MFIGIENRFRAVEKIVLAAQERSLDPALADIYCKLACVLVCGTIERSVEIVIVERVGARSPPQVSSFLRTHFKRGTNYDCEAIQQLLFKFDSGWGHKFEEFVSNNEQIKQSVQSCYALRNSIAHGVGGSLGPRVLKQYYDDSFTLIVELEALLRT